MLIVGTYNNIFLNKKCVQMIDDVILINSIFSTASFCSYKQANISAEHFDSARSQEDYLVSLLNCGEEPCACRCIEEMNRNI